MADYTIKYTQAVSISPYTVPALITGRGANLKLRIDPYTVDTYSSTELGDGSYVFAGVEDGDYRLYDDTLGAFVTDFAGSSGKWIGSNNLPYMGLATASEWGGEDLQLTSIADPTTANHVGDRGYNDARYLRLTGDTMTGDIEMGGNDVTGSGNLVELTGDQAIPGGKQFTGGVTIIPGTNDEYLKIHDGDLNYVAPEDDVDVAPKKYVDDLFVTVSVEPYQEDTYFRRVMPGGVVQTNQVYTGFTNAISSLPTPTANKQATVELQSTAGTAYTTTLLHSSLVNFLNIRMRHKGAYKHGLNNINGIVLGGATASITKKVGFENCVLYLGAQDITTARSYNTMTFDDCIIFAFKDLTLTDCYLRNITVFQASGFNTTIGAGTIVDGQCNFTQALTSVDAAAVILGNINDAVSTSYTMPTDPSVAS